MIRHPLRPYVLTRVVSRPKPVQPEVVTEAVPAGIPLTKRHGKGQMPRTVFVPAKKLYSRSTQMTITNMTRVARQFHFTPIHAPVVACQSGQYLQRLLGAWRPSAYFMSLYPWVWPPTYEHLMPLYGELAMQFPPGGGQGPFSILYVDDLPIVLLEGSPDIRPKPGVLPAYARHEAEFLHRFDILMVFNEAMRRFLMRRHGIPGKRILTYDLLDYPVDFDPPPRKKLGRKIRVACPSGFMVSYTGDWIGRLPRRRNIEYTFYGHKGEWITALKRPDLRWEGEVASQERLVRLLSENADWGIMAWAPNRKNYLKYGTGTKFSCFMAAGLPVLVSKSNAYPTKVVTERKVGLVFRDVAEIPELLKSVGQRDYDAMRGNALALGAKMRRSGFLMTAMLKAFEKSF